MVSHFRSSASSIGLWTNPVLVRLSRCCGAPTEGLGVSASGGGGAWQCCECAVARRGRRFAPSVRDGQGALAQGARRRSAGGGPLRACCQEGRALDAPPPWWPRQQHRPSTLSGENTSRTTPHRCVHMQWSFRALCRQGRTQLRRCSRGSWASSGGAYAGPLFGPKPSAAPPTPSISKIVPLHPPSRRRRREMTG